MQSSVTMRGSSLGFIYLLPALIGLVASVFVIITSEGGLLVLGVIVLAISSFAFTAILYDVGKKLEINQYMMKFSTWGREKEINLSTAKSLDLAIFVSAKSMAHLLFVVTAWNMQEIKVRLPQISIFSNVYDARDRLVRIFGEPIEIEDKIYKKFRWEFSSNKERQS